MVVASYERGLLYHFRLSVPVIFSDELDKDESRSSAGCFWQSAQVISAL